MKKIITYPTVEESIEKLGSNVYYIPSILENEDTFQEFRIYFYDMLKGGFEIKQLREYPVKFIFELGGKVHELQLRRFYVNLLMWYPLVVLGKGNHINETYIVTDYTARGRKIYLDNQIIIPFREEVDLVQLNIAINECIYLLSEIARDFNDIMADSMDMSSFVMLSLKNKKFHDLMNTQIDRNEQPGVVEKILDEKLIELMNILKVTENPLKATLLSGNNIKAKQLIEYFIAVGYKSTVDGKTIPVPISSNFCKGIKTIPEFYVESNSAVKALLANALKMGESGAWQKQMMSLCAGIRMDENVKDCSSIKPVKLIVKSQKYLDMLDGRYRIGFKGRRIPISSNDKHLIGKTILVKSPITCGCEPGRICQTCYGKLSKINGHTGVGALGTVKVTNPISQNVLSTKHLNVTDSVIIEFNNINDFSKVCTLIVNEIYIRKDIEEPLNNFRLIINKNDIVKLNDDDEGLDINEYVTVYYIKNIITGEIYEIREKSDKQLFISPELNSYICAFEDKILEEEKYVIDLEKAMEYIETINTDKETDSDDDEIQGEELVSHEGTLRLFITEIKNNELTQPFYDLMNIFSYYKPREEPTIEWMYQKVFDLMINAGLSNYPAVFFEIMIKALMRKASNIIEYPDFNTFEGAQDYQISVIKTALSKHPSALVGLSSTSVEEQLKRVATFDKSSPGFMDEFFRP